MTKSISKKKTLIKPFDIGYIIYCMITCSSSVEDKFSDANKQFNMQFEFGPSNLNVDHIKKNKQPQQM